MTSLLLIVFFERIGCFHVESMRILVHQSYLLGIAKICSSLAWSRSLRYFAVRNGSECLSDKFLSSMLPQLKAAKGCRGGRGGKNTSDVYRLTSKEALHQQSISLFTRQIVC